MRWMYYLCGGVLGAIVGCALGAWIVRLLYGPNVGDRSEGALVYMFYGGPISFCIGCALGIYVSYLASVRTRLAKERQRHAG